MDSAHSPSLTPIYDIDQVEAVLKAVEDFDLPSSSAWQDLDSLSSHTMFEGMDALQDGIFQRIDGNVEVVATAYVTLVYGGKSDEVSLTDAYPSKIIGHFDKQNFIVDEVQVDTSSFFD